MRLDITPAHIQLLIITPLGQLDQILVQVTPTQLGIMRDMDIIIIPLETLMDLIHQMVI